MIEQRKSAGHAPASETPTWTMSRLRELAKPTVEAWKTLFGLDEKKKDDRVQLYELTEAIASYGEMLIQHHLSAASETGQASAWQTMDSAPKDGTEILVTVAGSIDGEQHIAHWYAPWSCYMAYPRIERKWTHWMPLPLAPSEDETTTK